MSDFYTSLTNKIKTQTQLIELNPKFSLVQLVESQEYVLENKIDNKYYRISQKSAFIWETVRVNPKLDHLSIEYFKKFNEFPIDYIEGVLVDWKNKEIIVNNSIERLVSKYKTTNQQSNLLMLLSKIANLEIISPFFSQIINFFYVQILKPLFNQVFLIALIIGASFANGIFIFEILEGKIQFREFFNVQTIIIFFFMSIVSIILHEVGHGVAMNFFNEKVTRSGFRLYFFIPVFFVDSSASWKRNKIERVIISLSGVLVNWIIAGLSFIAYTLSLENVLLSMFFLNFASLNLINAVVNLIPFIEFDGYFILIDLISLPNLKSRSFGVLDKIRHKEILTKIDFILLAFLLLYMIFIVLFFLVSAYLIVSLITKLF